MLDHLDHIAIAVRDLESKVNLYRDVFGLTPLSQEEVPTEKVKVAYMGFEEAKVEFIQPLSQDSPIGKFLDKKGEGLHHLCFRVKDIEETIARAQKKGVEFIEPAPRKGSGGTKVAFIHPKSAGGILIELKEVKNA